MRYTLIVENYVIEGMRIQLLINLHEVLILMLKIDEKRAVLYQDSGTKLFDKLRDITFGMCEQFADDVRIAELFTDPTFSDLKIEIV